MQIPELISTVIQNSIFVERVADSLLSPLHYILKARFGSDCIKYYNVHSDDKMVMPVIYPKKIDKITLRIIKAALAILLVVPATLLGLFLKRITYYYSLEKRRCLQEWLNAPKNDSLLLTIKPNETETIKTVHRGLPPVILSQAFTDYLVGKEIAVSSRVCRNWHNIINKTIPWNNFWKNEYYPRTNLGRKLIEWFPDKALRQIELEEYDKMYWKCIQILGGQDAIDAMPLIKLKGSYMSSRDAFKQTFQKYEIEDRQYILLLNFYDGFIDHNLSMYPIDENSSHERSPSHLAKGKKIHTIFTTEVWPQRQRLKEKGISFNNIFYMGPEGLFSGFVFTLRKPNENRSPLLEGKVFYENPTKRLFLC